MLTFYFVAGEQVMTRRSYRLLDAWLSIENCKHLASEFRELPITAYDRNGQKICTRRWAAWHDALMRDTYGSDWHRHVDNAATQLR